MAIEIIKGDLFNTDADVIAHQVNCMGKMGSGVALQVKNRYGAAFSAYETLCDSKDDLLGYAQCVLVDGKIIANLFGQVSYGTDRRYTNYEGIYCALDCLNDSIPKDYSIAIPYNMGCDRGGGDWNIVYAMIESALKDRNVYIYRLKGD